MDIIIEEVRKVFGQSDLQKFVEKLITAYRQGGATAARAVVVEYLREFGINVEN